MSFVHLHLHTEYSMLDGLNRVWPLMEKVKKTGMDAVAISDHGVMYGVTEFWLAAKENNIKPIIGCEIYLAPGSHKVKKPIDGISYYHLLLLAKNQVGYHNLMKIVSIAGIEGMYYRPRIDVATLEKYSEGLICTTACLAGPVNTHILRNEDKKARSWLEKLKGIFKEDFYLELQRNGFSQEDVWKPEDNSQLPVEHIETIQLQIKANLGLRKYAEEYKVPLITTTDAHYLNKDDRESQEVLFAIKDGKQVNDPKRRLGYLDTYVKSPEEMILDFKDIPEVIDSTLEVAEKVEKYDIRYDRVQPHFVSDKKEEKKKSAKDLLRLHTLSGAKEMYKKIDDSLLERIDFELTIIHDKGYDDYFLVVSDIIKWARAQGIVVGVRGSVAGSVVAYCLDIINVEPVGWELYFERFLNPERMSPPDIDMDFQDDRRDEVIKYVENRYGRDNVAAIAAVGRMKTKAAIRDVARVMGIDLKLADQLSKMVHVVFGKVKPINKMMVDDPEFAKLVNSNPELQKLKDVVSKVEGMARHVSTHACGYLITPKPITDYFSVQYETGKQEGKILVQQEGSWIEELGLMKFDFLGLRNLTIIKNTIELVEKYHGVKIDTKKIPLDDKKTYELFGKGDTIGVFQFESPPMQKYLRDLSPENLEDLCFMVSAYRPGPMKYIPEYIECRHGRKEPKYIISEMEDILSKTYGFAIYQEQVIKIAVDVAGYSMGQADLLRRAMGKKKIDIMNKEEKVFKKGVMAKGYNDEIAQEIWNYLLPFADYGFNKAHGASYALIAYWCAYLKANYPIEFMAGLMHSDIHDTDRITIDINEARKMSFTILPPDINKSDNFFSIEKGKYIRFGLGAIKNVGENIVEEIVKERSLNGEFKGIDDFIVRMAGKKLTKKAMECLIMIGAFDNFAFRSQLLGIYVTLMGKAHDLNKIRETGQTDIFADAGQSKDNVSSVFEVELPNVPDNDNTEKIAWEKALLGTYITAHPLDRYMMALMNSNLISASKFNKENLHKTFSLTKSVKVIGVISLVKKVLTKKDSQTMAIVEIEDQYGKCSAVAFPRTYALVKDELVEGNVVVLVGKGNLREDELSLIIEECMPASSIEDSQKLSIDISNISDRSELESVSKLINSYKGGEVNLEIRYGDKNKKILTNVRAEASLFQVLNKYIINN